jgi:ubiquinone/menaquinone biosynthesis C-methylase UbiE
LILELGCGLGQDGRELMKRGFFVVQTDISEKTLKYAQNMASQEKFSQCVHLRMDSENVPFKNSSFEACFMVASLHHMMNPSPAIKEMKRCSKMNGIIIIAIEPNTWQYYCIFPIIRFYKKNVKNSKQYSPGDEATHGFNKKYFVNLAKQNDLKIIRISPVWYSCGWLHLLFQTFSKLSKKSINAPTFLEKICIFVDRCIEKIPVIKDYPWHWNVIMKKEV